MIEFFLVEDNDLSVAALVFSVAGAAGFIVQATMQTGFALYILGDVFMAIETEFGLRVFIEALVAFFTFMLVLDVPFDEFSRGERLFD